MVKKDAYTKNNLITEVRMCKKSPSQAQTPNACFSKKFLILLTIMAEH